MSILDQLISELGTTDKLQQMMGLCSEIMKEEDNNLQHPLKLPYGPNIFLAVEVPKQRKHVINYLVLERESEDAWVIILYTILEKNYESPDEYPKREKAFLLNEHRPKKILTEFAKKVKFYRGE